MSDKLFSHPREESKEASIDSNVDSEVASERGATQDPVNRGSSNSGGSTALIPSSNIQDHYGAQKHGNGEK